MTHKYIVDLTADEQEYLFNLIKKGELETEFRAAVDHYLAVSEQTGAAPQKPYSGKLMLRIPPEVHAHAAMMAEAQGKSLNQWAAEVLANAR